MTLRSPVGQARGLGSTRAGVEHWWMQRVTAAALVPLCLWLGVSLILLTGADHARFVAWAAAPVNAIGLLLLIGTAFYHFKIGLDVVIEDYVHSEGVKIFLLLANLFAVIATATACTFAVLRMAL